LVYSKYFKGIISYEGLQRIETFPIPRAAFREAVLNAIIHRDYSTGNPIHIHIYPDKVLIYNDGRLPESWTVEDLLAAHTSIPYNPLIANAFFRSGQIEAWGRGIEKISDSCKFWGKPEPSYRIRPNEVMIGFDTDVDIVKNIADNIVENVSANSVQIKILELMQAEPRITAKAIANEVGIAPRNVQVHIQTLKKIGLIERVGPAKGGHWTVKPPE
jgi:ATP-dependent DNA helicase RecG